MMRPFFRPVLCLVVLLLFGAATTAQGGNAAARFEIRFLTNMIDHHHMAVMMAELCEGRVIHPELEELCDSIMAAQTQEIAEMQAWLKDWYGITYAPQMSRKDMREMAKLEALSGAQFEVHFMMMMIEHHEKAIREAKRCDRRASHEELLAMCEAIVASQGQEIAEMQEWLCSWYWICP